MPETVLFVQVVLRQANQDPTPLIQLQNDQ
jgi:hypothetical protein